MLTPLVPLIANSTVHAPVAMLDTKSATGPASNRRLKQEILTAKHSEMGSASSVHRVLSLTCSEYAPSPTHPVQLMTKGTAPAPAATPAMPYLT